MVVRFVVSIFHIFMYYLKKEKIRYKNPILFLVLSQRASAYPEHSRIHTNAWDVATLSWKWLYVYDMSTVA